MWSDSNGSWGPSRGRVVMGYEELVFVDLHKIFGFHLQSRSLSDIWSLNSFDSAMMWKLQPMIHCWLGWKRCPVEASTLWWRPAKTSRAPVFFALDPFCGTFWHLLESGLLSKNEWFMAIFVWNDLILPHLFCWMFLHLKLIFRRLCGKAQMPRQSQLFVVGLVMCGAKIGEKQLMIATLLSMRKGFAQFLWVFPDAEQTCAIELVS